MNVLMLSFGDIIRFTVDGTALTNVGGAATSSRTVKPDGTTASDWKEFTAVEEGRVSGVFSDEDVFRPSPGAYRRAEVFRSMLAHDIIILGQEVNEIIVQSVLQTAALTNAKVDIGTKNGQIRGWLQITRAAQNDATVLLMEVYGIISVKDLVADGKRFKPQIEFKVLHNTLNEVTPSLAAGA